MTLGKAKCDKEVYNWIKRKIGGNFEYGYNDRFSKVPMRSITVLGVLETHRRWMTYKIKLVNID